jgi:hypothetical protein
VSQTPENSRVLISDSGLKMVGFYYSIIKNIYFSSRSKAEREMEKLLFVILALVLAMGLVPITAVSAIDGSAGVDLEKLVNVT